MTLEVLFFPSNFRCGGLRSLVTSLPLALGKLRSSDHIPSASSPEGPTSRARLVIYVASVSLL